jgi:PE family
MCPFGKSFEFADATSGRGHAAALTPGQPWRNNQPALWIHSRLSAGRRLAADGENSLASGTRNELGLCEEKSMSFVITLPEALAIPAATLESLGAGTASQNAAAATSTTGVSPAGADEVSALQATQFSAYGTLYQQMSAQAIAVHEMFVNTLGVSATSYTATEAANQAAASSPLSGLSALPR